MKLSLVNGLVLGLWMTSGSVALASQHVCSVMLDQETGETSAKVMNEIPVKSGKWGTPAPKTKFKFGDMVYIAPSADGSGDQIGYLTGVAQDGRLEVSRFSATNCRPFLAHTSQLGVSITCDQTRNICVGDKVHSNRRVVTEVFSNGYARVGNAFAFLGVERIETLLKSNGLAVSERVTKASEESVFESISDHRNQYSAGVAR